MAAGERVFVDPVEVEYCQQLVEVCVRCSSRKRLIADRQEFS
jgi:hypothetical protein